MKESLQKRIKAVAGIVSQQTTIATLGPEGTDSEAAARIILERKGLEGNIVLCESFDAARVWAIGHDAYFLIPAAYAARDENGRVKDTWGDFNFREMDSLELVDSIVLPLKEMCIARNRACETPESIALHPATDVFAERYAPGLRRDYVHSKPLVVERCSEGKSDLCIGSSDVAERFDNLEIERRFNPKMVWVLYSRR